MKTVVNNAVQPENLDLALESRKGALGRHLLEQLPITTVDLIPISLKVTPSDLRNRFPGEAIVACDLYVEGAESQHRTSWGVEFLDLKIANIDHHAEFPDLYQPISSGNLAAKYRMERGPAGSGTRVVINHTDCDSIVSSLIARGVIPPDALFEEAVIAADHTGDRNAIADILQALEVRRDVNFSALNLGRYLAGEPLEASAQKLLAQRLQGREETIAALSNGEVIKDGPLTVVHITRNMRNEFMPALFPKAAVILTYEQGRSSDLWVARLRLGKGAPAGFTLFDLDLCALDGNYGGRWNAGSNKRGGGSAIPLNSYIQWLDEAVKAGLERSFRR